MKPGDVLRGKYRIKRVLGEGGMGIVVRATHLKLDQDVAIKMLRADSAKSERVVARFAREARAAAKLQSRHVVRILDVDEGEGGAPFIVMEHLEGIDLDRLVRKRGKLPVEQAVHYVLEACEGLAEAHAAGIVHRDVKPANLFVTTTRSGEAVKLLDFGISKAPEAGDPTITEGDRLLGSPSFMSPEQIKAARDVDERTDIWALGVVLYVLLTAKLPFGGDSATSVAARIASEPPLPLDTSEIPADVVAIVHRCLEKDPALRFPSVAELAHALAPFSPDGAAAARRVSSVLRVPVAEPSAGSGKMITASWKGPAAGRVTASLSELDANDRTAEHAPAFSRGGAVEMGRATASVDAPGPVSLGGATAGGVDPRLATTAARSKPMRGWAIGVGVALVVGVVLFAVMRTSVRPTANTATASGDPHASSSASVPVAASSPGAASASAVLGASAAPASPASSEASEGTPSHAPGAAGAEGADSAGHAVPALGHPTSATSVGTKSHAKGRPPPPPKKGVAPAAPSADPLKLDLK